MCLFLQSPFYGYIPIFYFSFCPLGYFIAFYNQFSVAYADLVFVTITFCKCMAYGIGASGEIYSLTCIADVESQGDFCIRRIQQDSQLDAGTVCYFFPRFIRCGPFVFLFVPFRLKCFSCSFFREPVCVGYLLIGEVLLRLRYRSM